MSSSPFDINNLQIFETLFRSNYKILCNSALQIVKNEAVAEDIVQEVFIKLWENRSKIKIESNPSAYLKKMVVNAGINHLDKHKNIQINSIHLNGNVNLKPSFIESKLDYTQLHKVINEALDKLPPKCKAIFMLCRFEDMKYKEVAELLDISIKTVESQMGIAIKRLNQDLKPVLIKHFPDIMTGTLLVYLLFTLN